MADPFAGWDHNPDGQIKIRPAMGWHIAMVPMGLVVRLEYAEKLEDIDARRPSALQLHMNAAQARDLALTLLRSADRVDAQKPDTRPQ